MDWPMCLQGSLDELAQALARGDEMEGAAQATAAQLELPTMPSWRSPCHSRSLSGCLNSGSPMSPAGSFCGARRLFGAAPGT